MKYILIKISSGIDWFATANSIRVIGIYNTIEDAKERAFARRDYPIRWQISGNGSRLMVGSSGLAGSFVPSDTYEIHAIESDAE